MGILSTTDYNNWATVLQHFYKGCKVSIQHSILNDTIVVDIKGNAEMVPVRATLKVSTPPAVLIEGLPEYTEFLKLIPASEVPAVLENIKVNGQPDRVQAVFYASPILTIMSGQSGISVCLTQSELITKLSASYDEISYKFGE
jgi:hypothetical protein